MTEQEAIAKADTKWWEVATDAEIVSFQLYEEMLCMPFGRYHEAVKKVLGRPVWTHEFAQPELLRIEHQKLAPAPTMQQIIDQIPEEKRVIVRGDWP